MIVIPIIILLGLALIYIYLWAQAVKNIDNSDWHRVDMDALWFNHSLRILLFISFVIFTLMEILVIDDLRNKLEEQSKGCPEYEQIDAYILKEKQ